LLVRHLKYSAMLPKIHSYRLFFWQFWPLRNGGKIIFTKYTRVKLDIDIDITFCRSDRKKEQLSL